MLLFGFKSTPIKNAILQGVFAAWLELGNSLPSDLSSSPPEMKKLVQSLKDCQTPHALRSSLEARLAPTSPVRQELSAYCSVQEFLDVKNLSALPSPVEKLCVFSADGNPRSRRILAGLSAVLSGGSPSVPGSDEEESALLACEFFLESGTPELASRTLLRVANREVSTKVHLLTWRILSTMGCPREARAALEEGKERGCLECAGLLEADSVLGGSSSIDWKSLQRAAESGYGVALQASAISLKDGVGIDVDKSLADHYWCMSTMAEPPPPPPLAKLFPTASPTAPTLQLASNWASRHPAKPIHLLASRMWAEMVLR